QVMRLVYYEAFDKSTPETVADKIFDLTRRDSRFVNIWWMLDGADRGFTNTCKYKFDEDQNWINSKDVSPLQNRIIPVNFNTDHGRMLENLYLLIAAGHLAIPKEYEKLIIALRTARADRWFLDKRQTTNDDDLDSTRLALRSV